MTSRLCSTTSDSVVAIHQILQHRQEFLDVFDVQPGGWLVHGKEPIRGLAPVWPVLVPVRQFTHRASQPVRIIDFYQTSLYAGL